MTNNLNYEPPSPSPSDSSNGTFKHDDSNEEGKTIREISNLVFLVKIFIKIPKQLNSINKEDPYSMFHDIFIGFASALENISKIKEKIIK